MEVIEYIPTAAEAAAVAQAQAAALRLMLRDASGSSINTIQANSPSDTFDSETT